MTGSVKYAEYAGLSGDTKPTTFGDIVTVVNGERVRRTVTLATGSLFLEADTGDVYAFDEVGKEWNHIASLGGGS